MKKIVMIIGNFDLAILDVKKLNISKLSKVEKSLKIARDCLYQLRLEMRNMQSISPKDEIHFFKKQKPYIHGKIFFYLELNNFLLNYPETGISEQRIYIKEQIAILKSKKDDIFEFAKYCRLNATKYDHIYFLREDPQLDLFMNKNLEDPEFSTSHDELASKIVTFNLLMKFYTSELELLNSKKEDIVIKDVRPAILQKLRWTASKTALAELVISLHLSKAISDGEIELNKFVAAVELIFDINLGNIHKVFDQISDREKDPAKFLDILKNLLIKKINSKL